VDTNTSPILISLATLLIALFAKRAGSIRAQRQPAACRQRLRHQSNGLKLYYEDPWPRRPEKMPPLVLLHGGGLDDRHIVSGQMIDALAKHRQVIRVRSARPTGRTADIADRPFSFEQSANDAVELLKISSKSTVPTFAGFSNGGHIAIRDRPFSIPASVRNLRDYLSDVQSRRPPIRSFWDGFQSTRRSRRMPAGTEGSVSESRSASGAAFNRSSPKSVRRMLNFKDRSPEQIRAIGAPTLVIRPVIMTSFGRNTRSRCFGCCPTRTSRFCRTPIT